MKATITLLNSLALMTYNFLQLYTSIINELDYRFNLNKKYSIWMVREKDFKEINETIIYNRVNKVFVNKKSILFGPKMRNNQFVLNNNTILFHPGSSFKVKMKIHSSREAAISCEPELRRLLLYSVSMLLFKSPPYTLLKRKGPPQTLVMANQYYLIVL
jgi:hypothetical protein